MQEEHQVELSQIHNHLKKVQYINRLLSARFNDRLGVAAKDLFPKQSEEAQRQKRPFGSHIARALYANMAFLLFGQGQQEDAFFMQQLQHIGFGSVVNYKQIQLSYGGVSSGGVPADVLEKISVLTYEINELKKNIRDRDFVDSSTKSSDLSITEMSQLTVSKKRKRYLPSSVAVFELPDRTIQLPKFKRSLGLSRLELQARYEKGHDMLVSNGLAPTSFNLTRLGLGQRTVNCFKKNGSNDPWDRKRL